MDSSRVLYMLLCLLAVLHLTCQAPAWLTEDRVLKCPAEKGLYYDHGTGHCEDCRDICQFAKIQRTEEACQQQCPDYLRSQRSQLCKSPDQYYDDNVESCASCAELCSKPEVTSTLKECQNKCQGYLDRQAPKQLASHHSSDTLKASHTASNDKSSDEDTVDLHPGYIIAICAGGFVITFFVTFFIVHRQCNRKYEKTPQQDPDNGTQPSITPVEESSNSSSSQHFTFGPSSQQPLQLTGYSELTADRHPSIEPGLRV